MSRYRRVSLLGGISLGGAALLGKGAQGATNQPANDALNAQGNVGQPTVEAFVVSSPESQPGELRFVHILPGDGQNLELGRFEGDGLSGANLIGIADINVDQDAAVRSISFESVLPSSNPVLNRSTITTSARDNSFAKIRLSGQMPGAGVGLMSMSNGMTSGALSPARHRTSV